jgi:hypothetical protein
LHLEPINRQCPHDLIKKIRDRKRSGIVGNKCKNSSPLFLLHIIKLGHCVSSVAAWHIVKHTCEGTYCAKCQNFFISKKVPTWWWVRILGITILKINK